MADNDEAEAVDQRVLTVAAHLTAWRETNGDDVMDAALKLSEKQTKAAKAERDKAAADAAAASRAASGASSSAAPSGRSAADKSNAKA